MYLVCLHNLNSVSQKHRKFGYDILKNYVRKEVFHILKVAMLPFFLKMQYLEKKN